MNIKGGERDHWYLFDGQEFVSISDPLPDDIDDWNKAVAAHGWDHHGSVFPSEFSIFSADVHRSSSTESGIGILVSINDDLGGICCIICKTAPAFLVFVKEYVAPLIGLSGISIDSTLLDEMDGLPAVQRVANRRERERVSMQREIKRIAAEKAAAKP